MKTATISLKINKGLPGYSEGVTTTVTVDEHGTPLEKFWRDRLHDAETDNCVEIVKDKPKPQTKKDSPKEES